MGPRGVQILHEVMKGAGVSAALGSAGLGEPEDEK